MFWKENLQLQYLQAWVSDNTKIRVKERFLYLTTVLDGYDRKIIVRSLSHGMSLEETSLADWRMAIKYWCIEKGLVFHYYIGIQYVSKKFCNVIDSYKMITRSRSRKGNCLDNAIAERFFKTLKTEQIYSNNLISKELMELDIFEFIEI
jgi:putative transposase